MAEDERNDEFLKISLSDLKFERVLGSGSFGDVYDGEWISRRQQVAIKKLRIDASFVSLKERKDFFKEMTMMHRLRFSHILNVFGVCLDRNCLAIVVEYMSLGSLYDVIRNYELPWSDRWSIVSQITKGLNHLHQFQPNPIIHRDIKSFNFFMTWGAQKSDHRFIVKVGDFGSSRFRPINYRSTTSITSPTKSYSNKQLEDTIKCTETFAASTLSDQAFLDEDMAVISTALTRNQACKDLAFRNSDIAPIGVTFLSLGLAVNCTLTSLDLSENSVEAVGVANVARTLHDNSTLTTLRLNSTKMGDKGQLQIIADQNNGNRAIGTRGFNATLDYITSQLEQNTNLVIHHEYFTVRNSIVEGIPQLQSEINGLVTNHVYRTDFTHFSFSSRANFDWFIRLVSIPNLGCQESDWMNAAVADSVAIVKRGDCPFTAKSQLAERYRVKGLFVYNDGTAPDRFQPLAGATTHFNSTIPAYFLSYNLGMQFVNAASDPSTNAGIIMNIDVKDAEGIGNICADTPTGDKTKTIIIGSHSDGVSDGSGINDNGSGTVANLVLALNLARLLQTASLNYAQYPYRVRFCWWGAEELGLLGSIYHVEQASLASATIESGRLEDYLLYFNYDMLASPNPNFGISDSVQVPSGTPEHAVYATDRITDLFQQWFKEQKLPWTESGVGGGSDFVPFLTSGIAVGGVNTGAGGIKSPDERDQYAALMGTGNAGIANAPYDSCYHQQCDRITNVNPSAYEKVVKAAAYAIEHVGRLDGLEKWLYPQGRAKTPKLLDRKQLYNMHNDTNLF
ncbi:unnamed protein product [Adineta steineri]|uniref:Protein kinase domain-containing protein n=1 Tax=Adineta steineri TaxID=433720 RepID=A0A814V4F0_9BILA|nr:unnamed protein product [Adineta steineri]